MDTRHKRVSVPGVGAVDVFAERAWDGALILTALLGRSLYASRVMTHRYYGYGYREAVRHFRALYAREHAAEYGGAA